MSHPTRVYRGKLYYMQEDIRGIDSNYRMYNVRSGREEVLGEICVGTSMYPIWLEVKDIAEMMEW